ncbi:hypothetical protein H1R20_g6976, partial [Candolleomyces eurysporus]
MTGSPTLFSFALARQFTPFVVKLGPAWFRRKLVEWMPSRRVQKVKEISDVMHDYAGKILKERRDQQTRLLANGEDSGESGRPKDVISMLLKANEKAQHEERMSDDELTGQMTTRPPQPFPGSSIYYQRTQRSRNALEPSYVKLTSAVGPKVIMTNKKTGG